MATKNPAYGRLVTLKFGGTAILNMKASDFTQTRATRDVTTKESSDNEESRPTIASRSFSFSGIMPNGGPNDSGGAALQTAFDAGTIGTCLYGSGLAAEPSWSASGYLTSLNFKAPHDGSVDFDGAFKTTGVLTYALT